MSTKFYYILFISLLIASCNTDKTAKNSDDKSIVLSSIDGIEFPLSIQKGGKFRSLDQIRVQALSIIQHRNTEEPEALSMLTFGYWTPEFVFNGGTMSKPDEYKGYWIKFEDDFKYKYGVDKKTTGKGKYHFRLDDKSLYMLDDNVEFEPKVWTVNHNGDVIALVGTHEYGVNNGMQIKMITLDQSPI